MNRRDALRTMVAGAAALLPSWPLLDQRRPIDLKQFCADHAFRYDMTLPFLQGGKVYATDGKVCIRVNSHAGDMLGAEAKLPPADSLPFWSKGGVLLTAPPRVLTAETFCFGCDGTGLREHQECPTCEGEGYELDANCQACSGTGVVGKGKCERCGGEARMDEPWIVQVQAEGMTAEFDRRLWDKVQTIVGVEVRINPAAPARLSFDGGEGLLMPLDKAFIGTLKGGAS